MIIIIIMKKSDAFNSLKKIMIHWGFGEMGASIYALLALSDKPMEAREIAKAVGRAYSSVVTELNNLRRYGLVERDKDERCYTYYAITDIVQIISNERKKVLNLLGEIKSSLEEIDNKTYQNFIIHLDKAIKYLGKLNREV